MKIVSSQQGLKFINQQKVLHLIYNESPISRVEIAEKTGLTQQTVTNIVQRLMEDKLVVEGQSITGAKGRNPIPLSIQGDKMYAIGVELAVKYVRGKLIDFQGQIISEVRINVKAFEKAEETLACLKEVVHKLLKKVSNQRSLKGMGISIHALVDSQNGSVIKSPGLAMENFPLVEILKKEFDFPIFIENDVNLLAIIENQKGSLTQSENNIVLKLDYGIGGSIINHKQLFVGSSHVAGEFGHIKAFTGSHAFACPCGTVGCLTTLASASGLIANKGITLEEFDTKIRSGDAEAKRLFELISEAVGLALSNIVTFINPDQILLTGKVIKIIGDLLVPQVNKIVNKTVPESCRNVKIHYLTEQFDESALAARLVIKSFFDVPLEILSL